MSVEKVKYNNVAKVAEEEQDYQLLSPIIKFNPQGNYNFTSFSFLAPHEALRREFIRGERALLSINEINSDDLWKFEPPKMGKPEPK